MKKHFLLVWLLFFGSIGLAMAQSRQVQGVVKSAEGEALPGVTVLVEGTTNGASTGVNGDYSLTLPAASAATAKLRFSFVGYTSKEVTVGDQTTINVTLAADSKQLEDVVVIGYQEVQRRDVTGSVSSVSAQQIKDVPVNSAAEALTGRLAGVQLTSAEGTPGNLNVQVRVRGGGSITQDNSPLYVVDGIQIENALSVIAPQDIASVDVLKDASATAIYGARGANGVIIITTKKGSEGRTVVSYNGFVGVRRIAKTLSVLQPQDYLNYEYERSRVIGNVSGGLPTFKSLYGSTNFNSDTLLRARNAPFVNWQDEVFGRDAYQQTHNVSVAGGAKGTTYSLSLTRNDEQGIQRGSDYSRNLLNFRFDTKASDKFRIGLNVRYNDQGTLGAGTSTTGSNTTSRLRNAVQYQPLLVPRPDGFVPDPAVFDSDVADFSGLVNPIVTIDNEYRNDKRRTINIGANASYEIVKGLTFRTTAGFDITDINLGTFNGRYSPTLRSPAGGYSNLPFATLTTTKQATLNNSNVLDYSFKSGKHSGGVLLGEEVYQQRADQIYIQTNFLPLEITAERALANINQGVIPAGQTAQPVLPQTSIPADYRQLSGFGRLTYSYDDKYLFTGTFRVDGSSKFPPGKKLGFFPGASAAWRISREEFFKDIPTITDLKLRLSYGQAGNNRINDFLYNQLFQAGSAPYALNHTLVLGSAATGLANPNLIWESTTTRNIGIDLALLDNRVQFTADAYYNTTSDLLLNKPVPAFLGYTTQLQNVGSTSNKGLELQLTGNIVRNENFSWTATANASFNRGRIESLGGDQQQILGITSGWGGTALTQDYLARVGRPVGEMYGYVTDGYLTANDFSGYVPPTTSTSSIANSWTPRTDIKFVDNLGLIGETAYRPGLLKLKDLNGDGKIDANDQTVIGNANPKMVGGLNQQFTFKGFDASVFLNFVLGNDVYNANKIEFTSNTANTAFNNVLGIMGNRYRIIEADGSPITTIARLNEVNQNANIWTPTRNLVFHSWAVEDGSFLRVNNITVGYTLPKALTGRAKIQSLRFYLTANNVYTFTKYTGYDPEVNTRRATPLTPGVDYAAYPRSRALLFGVNLSL
ncbi:SusC/RagA family TonB-linked outer membrane protein [Hymenobacter armeniacus]|uniref:TonB-dependent receptor n=1 Tax=Hymenobacter armeniacus TaxID=2771358 RepID=A0ABR8K1Z6_9BACT|nr:TonB-dependent receptor [Hymenobacter armeniacus]MBD2724509.1 TonB-dependent receptor [Hymenobacter armeniacus]